MPDPTNPKSRTMPAEAPALVYAADAYAELDVATNFSFLRGASHPDEVVFRAVELGYRAIAVTDRNTFAGVVRAHEAAKKAGLKLLVGSRLCFADAPDVLVWCGDRPAYARLCRLLTTGKRRAEKGGCALWFADLEAALADAPNLLAALVPPDILDPTLEPMLRRLRDSAIGVDQLSIASSCLYGGSDTSRLRDLVGLSRGLGIPLLATNGAHYHVPGRRPLQDVLTCIRHGCTIHDAGYRLFPNGERYLKSPAQMRHVFASLPSALRRGVEIAERCAFSLDELRYEYPDEIVPPGKSIAEYLRELTEQGAILRYPQGVPEKVRKLIEHELKLIGQLKYEAYFLTVHDVVKYARSIGILCQGRGSAANSAVCYCLGITPVDPNEIDVLFERFVSAARKEPPDIDVDFEHERREEVLQYLYEKYGRQRVGMTGVVITYRGRSAVRDVGKALGLSLDLVDQMAKRLDGWAAGTMTEAQLREIGLDPAERTVRQVVALTGQLLGFPRHLSQHVGGMVMTRGDLCDMVPIENAAMDGRTVIEWDKDDIDTIGMLKVDVLALGMLTCVSKAVAMISALEASGGSHRGIEAQRGTRCNCTSRQVTSSENEIANSDSKDAASKIASNNELPSVPLCLCGESSSPTSGMELHHFKPKDPAVFDMICAADTIGVFQIESRAQMSMLPRLLPRCFYDLVIEVAIVRPGPIQGNMVHPYLRRRTGEEQVTFPSEALRAVLEKTLGVPLFQEQAMKVVMVAAGFTADEADQLRKSMAAWRKTHALEQFRGRVIDGMLANGYDRAFAEQTFDQIRGFGEYGFPESHAAAFAHLVYVSAWLKRHHPAVFAASLINSQPMGFYAPAQIVRDAKEHGVEVRAVDVNWSEWDCLLEENVNTGSHRDTKAQRVAPSDHVSLPWTIHFESDHSVSDSQIDPGEESLSDEMPSVPPCLRGSAPRFCESRSPQNWGKAGPVIRLGMRIVRGLRADHAHRIVEERRRNGPFTSIRELQLRTSVPKPVLQRLAEADAFGSMGLPRRESLWQVLGLKVDEAPLFEQWERDQFQPPSTASHGVQTILSQNSALPPMPPGQEVMTDYATAGLSLKAHPVGLVREVLRARQVITAAELRETQAGKWVRVAGLVLVRQRPGTASGIVFETVEDETGIANLIVRPKVYEQYKSAARYAVLVEAQGIVERQGEVIHVMVKKMEDLTYLVDGLRAGSRDFH